MIRWNLGILLLYLFSSAYAIPLVPAHLEVHGGAFLINHGKQQHINMKCWVGDEYLIDKYHDVNAVAGVGYFIDLFNLHYLQEGIGINGFYFPKTKVSGTIVQENLFTNLAYEYSTNNYPIYAESRTVISMPLSPLSVIIRLGGGINIIQTNKFRENSLDGGITIPDNIFLGRTNTQLSASAGAAIKFDLLPLECGYRFFYLGKGYLKKNTDVVFNTITTGNAYANAAICTLHI